ncbi:ATP synthase protein I [Cohaesibacter marisflavi]|uniref:ATP synthase protein I n=1 Tax=Cohaesibacter marisflavi TaxID=655353 RepID=A0A1I5E7T5_9HYPH|nr:AtpZ/AtpI family protein [Cohaesibacter marisflavi]SFO07380.1 ATP synthase protein I [Cohaesibacter marisflavi]
MPGNEDHKLDDRLGNLDAELAKMRESQATKNRAKMDSEQSNGLAMAWRLGSEFVAGVLVGTAIGWLIDEWLGIRPWGMIIFLLLGFLAGMLNLLRSAGKLPPPGA